MNVFRGFAFLSRQRAAAFALALLPLVLGCPTVTEPETPTEPAAAVNGTKPGPEDGFTFSPNDLDPKLPGDGHKPANVEPQIPPPKLVEATVREMRLPDGTLKRRWGVKRFSDDSEVNHGVYEEYLSADQKFAAGEYTDGQRSGEWTYWHPNGSVAKQGTYSAGKLQGIWKVYRADGTLERQESYQDGKNDGRWFHYSDNGKDVLRQEEYKGGLQHGKWITWHPRAEDNPEGKLVEGVVATFVNGKLQGEMRRYFEDGKPAVLETYDKGVLNGKATQWNRNGEVLRDVIFEEGRARTTLVDSGDESGNGELSP